MSLVLLGGSVSLSLGACADTESVSVLTGPLVGVAGGAAWVSRASHELRIFVDSTERVTGLKISRLTSVRSDFRRAPDVPVGKRLLASRSARLRVIDSVASATPGLVVTVYQTARGERVQRAGLGSSVLHASPSSPAASSAPPATAAEVEAIVDAAIAELESQSNEILAEAEWLAEGDLQQLVHRAVFLRTSDEVVNGAPCTLAICSDIAEKRLQYETGTHGVIVATVAGVVEVVGAGLIAVAVGSSVGVVAATVGLATVAGLTGQYFAGTSLMEKARALRRCLRGEEVRQPTPTGRQSPAFVVTSAFRQRSMQGATVS